MMWTDDAPQHIYAEVGVEWRDTWTLLSRLDFESRELNFTGWLLKLTEWTYESCLRLRCVACEPASADAKEHLACMGKTWKVDDKTCYVTSWDDNKLEEWVVTDGQKILNSNELHIFNQISRS